MLFSPDIFWQLNLMPCWAVPVYPQSPLTGETDSYQAEAKVSRWISAVKGGTASLNRWKLPFTFWWPHMGGLGWFILARFSLFTHWTTLNTRFLLLVTKIWMAISRERREVSEIRWCQSDRKKSKKIWKLNWRKLILIHLRWWWW